MQNPQNLIVLDHARRLAVSVYRLTAKFPAEERFGLTRQMRDAAVSIGCNIAEGCGRRGNRELLQFLYVAFSSAKELAFQVGLSSDLDFGVSAERERVAADVDHVERMLNRLTAYLRNHPGRKRKEDTP